MLELATSNAASAHRDAAHVPPEHEAAQLTEGGSIARIRLGESLYTLRITRAGKLILTK